MIYTDSYLFISYEKLEFMVYYGGKKIVNHVAPGYSLSTKPFLFSDSFIILYPWKYLTRKNTAIIK